MDIEQTFEEWHGKVTVALLALFMLWYQTDLLAGMGVPIWNRIWTTLILLPFMVFGCWLAAAATVVVGFVVGAIFKDSR